MTLKRSIPSVPASPPPKLSSNQAVGQSHDQHNETKTVYSLTTQGLSLQLEGRNILTDITLQLPQGITALIGPSGAGKSSLLRCINRLHEYWAGNIDIAGICVRDIDADALRRQIGLIGQKPAIFPCSIRENVIFGLPRRQRKSVCDEAVRKALIQAALWQEVSDRLHDDARTLSIGQQQRLCLARALILNPSFLMLDEPTSALDPRSRDIIERSLRKIGCRMPLLWVTHDLEQARRISEHIIFICDGKLIEQADAAGFFARPEAIESREFLRWNVCDCE